MPPTRISVSAALARGLGVVVLTFLLVTNPVVADAARTITGRDIENGSVTGKDVKNRSLARKDFKRGQLPAGPAGPSGPAGAAGPAGASGVSGYQIIVESQAPLGSGSFGMLETVTCPAGKRVLSGGIAVFDATGQETGAILTDVHEMSTSLDGSAWKIKISGDSGSQVQRVDFRVACAFVS
jgi:hypothetical protein